MYVCIVYSISHDLLNDSFAGIYIVMLMNGSGDDEYWVYYMHGNHMTGFTTTRDY